MPALVLLPGCLAGASNLALSCTHTHNRHASCCPTHTPSHPTRPPPAHPPPPSRRSCPGSHPCLRSKDALKLAMNATTDAIHLLKQLRDADGKVGSVGGVGGVGGSPGGQGLGQSQGLGVTPSGEGLGVKAWARWPTGVAGPLSGQATLPPRGTLAGRGAARCAGPSMPALPPSHRQTLPPPAPALTRVAARLGAAVLPALRLRRGRRCIARRSL